MTERDQQALQKGFQGLGDNIDRLYARPLQKVSFRGSNQGMGAPCGADITSRRLSASMYVARGCVCFSPSLLPLLLRTRAGRRQPGGNGMNRTACVYTEQPDCVRLSSGRRYMAPGCSPLLMTVAAARPTSLPHHHTLTRAKVKIAACSNSAATNVVWGSGRW